MKFHKLKFKTIAVVLLLAVIICAAFIRIIPDYSTSRGFAVVSLSDYNKYKQGYCLKENRILPEEELYKRAIGQYLDYDLKLDQMINDYRTYNYGSSRHSAYEIAYYELENINLSNWFEVLQKYYKKGKTTEEILIKELKAKKTDPKKYLKISSDGAGFGFDRPIVRVDGDDKTVIAYLLLDKFVLVNKNYLRYNHSEYLYDRAEIDVITKKYYEDRSKVMLFDTKKRVRNSIIVEI
ncbi:hypothetical protein [Campylobacter showae]|uniref:hypothetical protein n=1 Tax=Campylobacter showae TaxID=204 RepID=UPI0028D20B68|nr:hypothetical protein [Campylobacter showae]